MAGAGNSDDKPRRRQRRSLAALVDPDCERRLVLRRGLNDGRVDDAPARRIDGGEGDITLWPKRDVADVKPIGPGQRRGTAEDHRLAGTACITIQRLLCCASG